MLYVEYPKPSDYRKAGLGNGLSQKNQLAYRTLYIQQQNLTENVLRKVAERIEWANTAYEKALVDNRENMKLFSDLTLNWNPQRVLTTYKYFLKLCSILNDERIWKLLNRSQRKFISEAYQLWVDRRR